MQRANDAGRNPAGQHINVCGYVDLKNENVRAGFPFFIFAPLSQTVTPTANNRSSTATASDTRPHIVVLGAGFGGLTFCQRFPRDLARISLVDRHNHHLFQPLLYQVATAGLALPDIAQPIRSILSRRRDVTVLLEEARGFDTENRRLICDVETLAYDYLVLALGGVTSYFGHPEWARFAPGLKSLEDASRIRRQVLLAFEHAETTKDEAERRQLMTLVVVGGGPTGVELAGALAELARFVLRRDFRRIDPGQARVILVEAADRILGQFPNSLSLKGRRQLEAMGVEVRTGAPVEHIDETGLRAGGVFIPSANVIWAAGVRAHPLTGRLGAPVDRAGRIRVEPDLSVPGLPGVYAVGDLVSLVDAKGQPVPGVSPAAMQMAAHAAREITAAIRSDGPPPRRPFIYRDKGTMATIGRSRAVAQIGRMHLTGFPAWLAWLGVHLVFLIGFRNKLSVLMQWMYAYFAYKRGSRVVVDLFPPDRAPPPGGPEAERWRSPSETPKTSP
ncbi:MAG: NAD(P)/FAD-dependent oxidoreductase [Puniceicoccaceae bacterium]|nr:MAG: NAD(P)/FAD-dependent oxidoreductase [Puniceicoccaceae bacterium]